MTPTAPQSAIWTELPPEAIASLTQLGQLTDELANRQAVVHYQVDEARRSGASWRMIGVALGTTGQAAWERYSGRERDSEIPVSAVALFDVDEHGSIAPALEDRKD